jgi:hypothetical protein
MVWWEHPQATTRRLPHLGDDFWHLDGSGMDDDFAFDISCSTRDEWEARSLAHSVETCSLIADSLDGQEAAAPTYIGNCGVYQGSPPRVVRHADRPQSPAR